MRLTVLLLAEAGAILGLHLLAFETHWRRILDRPVEEAVASSLRYVALALAYWLLVSTVAYSAARLSRIPGAIRGVRWTTLPAVRRVVDRALAVGVTMSALVTPAVASAQIPTPTTPVETTASTYVPAPAGDGGSLRLVVTDDGIVIPPGLNVQPAPAENMQEAPESPPDDAAPSSSADVDEYTIRPGDNLWNVASSTLAAATDTTPDDGAVATYWVELIAANLDRLSSGDPDLIYPGETIVLPPVTP
jgi:hypothetical protein